MQRRHFSAAIGAAVFTPGLRAAEPGVTDNEVVFGQTGILSGPLGGPVKTMMAGSELAFAESRLQGGVNGRKVRIVSLDDELKPERAIVTTRSCWAPMVCSASSPASVRERRRLPLP